MANAIHITTAKKILDSHDPVSISFWTPKGEIQTYNDCISLRYNFYEGTRNVKLRPSNEIRKVRDVCIFRLNGMEVYL